MIPFLSLHGKLRDSGWYIWWDLIQATRDALGRSWWYVILPADLRDDAPTVTPADRVTFLWDEALNGHHANFHNGFVYGERFRSWFGVRQPRYLVDVTVTSRPALAYALGVAQIGDKITAKRLPPPVVYMEPSAEYLLAGDPGGLNAPFLGLNRVLTYLTSSQSVFLAAHERAAALRVVRETVAPALYLDVEKKCRIIEPYVRTPDRVESTPGGVPLVMFGGRLNSAKGIETVLDVMARVVRMGPQVRCVVTTPMGEKTAKEYQARFLGVEFYADCGREQYYGFLTKAAVFVVASSREAFAVGFCEVLTAGVPLVVPRTDWVASVLPGYPYVYSDARNAASLVEWIVEHQEQARDVVAGYVRDRKFLTRAEWGQAWAGLIRDSTVSLSSGERVARAILDRLGWPAEVNWTRFLVEVMALYRPVKSSLDYGVPTPREVADGLERLGYVDTCESEVPTWVKSGTR